MIYIGNIKAFTFIELIITISILIVLGFIGFFTINTNLELARDSSKITSLNNIKTTLINYKLNNSLYPDPTNYSSITYSGEVLWKQGIIGKNTIKEIKGSKPYFLDPITNNEYTYSVTNNKREFQIAGVLEESTSTYISYISSYASSKKKAKAVVLGDYNGLLINVKIEGSANILALPSIITSDLFSTKLIDIISNNNLVYNGGINLPASYKNSIFEVNGGQDLSSNRLVLFSGSLDDFRLESNRLLLLDSLNKSYNGTLISKLGNFSFVDLNIDLLNPSVKSLSLACGIVEFNIHYPIKCSNDTFFAVPIFNNINLSNIDFSGLISQKVNTVIQDSNNNLWFGTDKGLSKYSSGIWTSYTTSNGLVNNKVKTIIQSSNGNIWVGTKGGISVFNSGNFTSYTVSNGLVNNEVKTIIQSSIGNMWIGTDKGVSLFNSGNFTSYTASNGLVNNQVKTIIQSSSGGIWVATEKGISVFNPITSLWSPYTSVLVSSDVIKIFQSNDNKIWVATNKGVSVFDGVSWSQYTVTDGLISNKVKDIFQDNSQNIWFITKKGLSKLVSGSFTNYPNGNNQGIYVVYQSNGITIIGIK